ncbi:MAG: proteinase inhibitor [Sandaracinus sp.]|nr:proteinase inhibitor [Sandaracinus sp.]MCB9636153.1 proteinase inhibitor [Sandaracinus sp.]
MPDSDGGTSSGDFLASCSYVNAFSEAPECKEYRGSWTQEAAERDCQRVFLGRAGTFALGEACGFDDELGRCVVGDLAADGYALVSSGDPSTCDAARNGCETFAGGTFAPEAICDVGCTAGAEIPQPFLPMYVDCRAPREGEPAGATDGQVCTPTIISGSTEPGRRYAQYADCDVVRTQRPYYAMPTEITTSPEDPRLADATYMDELAWVKSEAEASACACCHTTSDTPSGAAVWDTEAGDLWVDTVSDEALAMLAGYTDSAAFGFLPTEQNNGFDRSTTGLPSTDVPRLRAFLDRELTRRGLTIDEARELPPFAPFFRELIEFEPEACDDGIGLDAEGTLHWTGGNARYLSVLEADAQAPGVPPNFDLPEGTLWSIAVSPEATSIACSLPYGTLPEGVSQRVPAEGPAPTLQSGRSYFLYVQRDVAQPITRCLFVAP